MGMREGIWLHIATCKSFSIFFPISEVCVFLNAVFIAVLGGSARFTWAARNHVFRRRLSRSHIYISTISGSEMQLITSCKFLSTFLPLNPLHCITFSGSPPLPIVTAVYPLNATTYLSTLVSWSANICVNYYPSQKRSETWSWWLRNIPTVRPGTYVAL